MQNSTSAKPDTSSTESSILDSNLIQLEPEVRIMSAATSTKNFSGVALVSAIRAEKLKDYKSVPEALAAGLFEKLKAGPGFEPSKASPQMEDDGMSLSEALSKGLVDNDSGKVTDRYSGKSVKLSDAIKRGLINPNTLEIFPVEGPSHKISLKEALEKNIVNETTGKYANTMSFDEAAQKKLISACWD